MITKLNHKELWDKYVRKLLEVNDENKTWEEHQRLELELYGWMEGAHDATGDYFNGDHYYMDTDMATFTERPMCCGKFLDWKSKVKDPR